MATVLVVDDEPIVREVVVRYLEREGYATLETGNGNDARLLVERESLDLVVRTRAASSRGENGFVT
jgi:CheY-like chemotaxis protein